MATAGKIPTPFAQRWRTIRYQFMPIGVFVVSVVITAVLWDRHIGSSQLIGEVVRREAVVGSPLDGTLVARGSMPLELYQRVGAGEVIAVLNSEATLAALAALQAQKVQLVANLAEVEETVRVENQERRDAEFDRQLDKFVEQQRLKGQIDRLRVEILGRRVEIETDRIAHARWSAQFDHLKRLGTLAVRSDVIEAEHERNGAARRIKENEQVNTEALAQLKRSQQELARIRDNEIEELKLPDVKLALANLEKLRAPIEKEILYQEALINELQVQVRSLNVRAPFAGKVTAIWAWPGQSVRVGAMIATIAATEGEYIVTYVRQRQQIRPAVGDLVDLRLRTIPTQSAEGKVVEVGAQFEPVPLSQLRDLQTQEWGLPVRIEISKSLRSVLSPGELVDISFRDPGRERAQAPILTASISLAGGRLLATPVSESAPD